MSEVLGDFGGLGSSLFSSPALPYGIGVTPIENLNNAPVTVQPGLESTANNTIFSQWFDPLAGTGSPTTSLGVTQNTLTPAQSATPNTNADFFSQLTGGIGNILSQAIPQWTSTLAQGGITKLNQSLLKTPAQSTNSTANSPASANYTTILIIGAIVVGAFLILRK